MNNQDVSNHNRPAISKGEFSNLVELLSWRAELQPDRIAYTFLRDGAEQASLTYGQLDREARAIAASLQSRASLQERALLLYEAGREFIPAFFGCLYAGIIAVPTYPPEPTRLSSALRRLEPIVSDATPTVVLTTQSLLPFAERLSSLCEEFNSQQWIATDSLDGNIEDAWRRPGLTADTLAFLQYTSGSTASPKGVMISHRNLLHNERLIEHACGHTEQSTFVSWLPLYHDMGLIGTVLQPLYIGARGIIMPPLDFLQKPLHWLQAISRYRAATSGGPDFGFALCVRKITHEQRADLDLSSWKVAFNGAEPIRHETLERFVAAFEPCGFRREAFLSCYGLAEATLIVSGSPKESYPALLAVRSQGLERSRVEQAFGDEQSLRMLVSSGRVLLDQEVAIVNPDDRTRCLSGQVGEIWVSGPSVAPGYWDRPKETEQVFKAYVADTGEGPFLRTGDIGFLEDDELFVTARLKDLIIIRGRNHYPHDIELTVERSHPALRPGCGAAFSVDVDGQEQLVIVQEVENYQKLESMGVIETVRRNVTESHELQVAAIALIKPRTIYKTSSGKIQRYACRRAFLDQTLDMVAQWRADASQEIETQFLITPSLSVGAIEAWLISHLAAKLGIAPHSIKADDPIARYGLDSLAAIELTHSIESYLNINVPMASLLQDYTISQIAAKASEQLGEARPPSQLIEAVDGKPGNIHPLSHGQQAMWLLYQLAPESVAYNISAAAQICGDLSGDALQRSFHHLVERHACLRTTFAAHDGEPLQIIRERIPEYFHERDVSASSEDELSEYLESEANRPFDLARGPLVRVLLLRKSARESVLLFALHHIVADFWSLCVLMRELEQLYVAETTGSSHGLDTLSLQYSDYARWQAEMLESEEGERLWSYWSNQLAGELPVLNLPADKPRPPMQSYNGASRSFKLSQKLSEKLCALARAHNTTPYTVLLAAFQVLLHRYTGQEDILIGSPTAGRRAASLKGLVGYFVNPVVLRADLSGNPEYSLLLESVRHTVLDAYHHQDYPFASLVERLQPERDPSRSPVFQVMFALQKAPTFADKEMALFALGEQGAKIRLGPLEMESISIKQRATQFDLALIIADVEGSLAGSWQYNTEILQDATIARMAKHFEVLLDGIVTNPRTRLSDLPLLVEAERCLFRQWNDTRVAYSESANVSQLIEAQARSSPDAVALINDDEHMSYHELNRRANQLAHRLRSFGVKPETRVAVCMERSPQMVVAMLAVLKAEGAYLPLDPAYPKQRLAFILQDAQAPLVLTEQKLAGKLPQDGPRVLLVDADWEFIEQESGENLSSRVMPHNLAYVIYTSGSTGEPKGVEISHSALLNLTYWHQADFNVSPNDRSSQICGVAFDATVWELWPYLTAGASIDFPDEPTRISPSHLQLWLISRGITIALLPTPLAEAVLRLEWPDGSALRILHAGGDRLHHHPSSCLPFELINNYGPTEYTVVTTSGTVPVRRHQSSPPAIGKPIANTQVHILDSRLAPVPIGVEGELHIGGAGLARGYLNRADLTSDKFIPNPFSDEAGARLYKTGDRARFLPDGTVEFLGRADGQVKVRGFRIELGEIETVLNQHLAVSAAVAMVRENEQGQKCIVAYVVVSDPGCVPQLRGFLKQRLPDFMLPSAFVPLESLPLTPNGKPDRRVLLSTQPTALKPQAEFTFARTPVKDLLTSILEEVLGVESVGIHDNFFELGGHSLLAARVISRIQEAFHVEVPLRRLFESPTAAGLAVAVEDAIRLGKLIKHAPIERVSRQGPLPLSFAQSRLWFLYHIDRASPAYHIPFAITFESSVNLAALERSLNEIIRRHESLRTTFATLEGRPVQIVAPARLVTIPVTDLSALQKNVARSEAQRLSVLEARQPFDLTRDLLIRTRLVKLSEEDYIWIVTIHHVAADGWSIEIFWKEFAALYKNFCEGQLATLPELPVQYADFAQWQRECLQGDAIAEQLAYWKKQLAGAPLVLELPADRPRPAMQSHNGAILPFELSHELMCGLKELSHRNSATWFMTLMAAFKVLLHRYTGREDLLVGTPVANRHKVDIEPLIGFFSNMLILRTDLSGNPSFLDLLERERDVVLGAYAHQDLPVERLVEEMQPERSVNHAPLFQVALSLHDVALRISDSPGLSLQPIHNGTAKLDLLMNVFVTARAIVGGLEYNTDLFEAETIRRMILHFTTLLESIVANPEQSIRDLQLLTETERVELLKWNNEERAYNQGLCLQEFFQSHADRAPYKTALVLDQQRVSYKELNDRANQLARYLRRLGVGPETHVAVFMERSVETIVGLIAIMKAGGAYVPLDPAYPKSRLALILEDAQAIVILTQQRLMERLPEVEAKVVGFEREWEAFSRESTRNLDRTANPENVAYVLYTSGSTGKPNGVPVTHHNVGRLFEATESLYQFDSSDVWTLFHSYTSGFSVWELWGALVYGGTLVLVPNTVGRSPQAFYELLISEEVTVLNQTPSAFRQLMVVDKAATTKGLKLRLIIFGGQALEAQFLRGWIDRHGDEKPKLFNMYGITETTGHVTYRRLKREDLEGRAGSMIGKAIEDLQVYLLDEQLGPAPIGAVGEIFVAGDGLARGYFGKADMTAERFIPNPYAKGKGGRLYRSGDLGRYLSNGEIEYLGRNDQQVKIRGHRIELGEIEAVLMECASVRAAGVVVEANGGEGRLVAYIVGSDMAISDMREFVKKRLPDYMAPAAYVMMEQLPLTASGKLDRRALPAADDARAELQVSYAPPETDMERTIAAIWQRLLKVEKVGLYDNFFDVGANSLLLIQASSELEGSLQREVSVIDLFKYSSIKALAQYLSHPPTDVAAPQQSHAEVEARKVSMRRRSALRRAHSTRTEV